MTSDRRAARNLRSLQRWLQRFDQFVEAFDTGVLDPREREAFPLEWDNILDRLVPVEAMARSGELQADEIAALQQVAEGLADRLPTMRRLSLRLPDLEALERARRSTVA